MRTARFAAGDSVHEGTVTDGTIETEDGEYALADVDLLPPCRPSKVVGTYGNYTTSLDEGESGPDRPPLFLKPPSSVVGDGDAIAYPDTSGLKYEGELAVVVDEECSSVPVEDGLDYVRGYTCANDVTASDWEENQWVRSKGADTFCPLGPVIRTDVGDSEPELDVETRVNGEVVQSESTGNLIFGVAELVAEISEYLTLEAGDVILTGAPPGVGPLDRGDTVEVELEGIGTLRNEAV